MHTAQVEINVQRSRREVGADRGERPAPVSSANLLTTPNPPLVDLMATELSKPAIRLTDRDMPRYDLAPFLLPCTMYNYSTCRLSTAGSVQGLSVVASFLSPRAQCSRVLATQWGLVRRTKKTIPHTNLQVRTEY